MQTFNPLAASPLPPGLHPQIGSTVASLAERPTVFVVEDDVDLRDVLNMLLGSAGIAVEAYRGAAEFLESYDPRRPGCVLLDVNLPGMSGLELQQRLASQDLSPPIIFLTGQNDVPTALQAMRTGAVDFLQKPFTAAVLLGRIREAISRDDETRRSHSAGRELEIRRGTLTPREQEVMDLLAAGHSTKAIAVRLEISPKTVDKHRAKVLDKMQVDNPTELAHLLLGRRSRTVEATARRP
jgi:two-component system, LuxR family, response regulator FixJ